MNALLQNLLNLQALEFGEIACSNLDTETAALRAQIPAPILGHYDRLRARDKKGLAAIRNQVCTGCHMRQPLAKITVLMREEDIQLCDTCGRYLYLPPEPEAKREEATAEKAPEKPAKAPRKRKARQPAPPAAATV